MNTSLLQVNNLVVEFTNRHGTLRALDGVSFDIAPGEILGVVGESGAGKSLTGAAIIGLLEPPGKVASGEIVLKGQRSTTCLRMRCAKSGPPHWCHFQDRSPRSTRSIPWAGS